METRSPTPEVRRCLTLQRMAIKSTCHSNGVHLQSPPAYRKLCFPFAHLFPAVSHKPLWPESIHVYTAARVNYVPPAQQEQYPAIPP